MLASFLFAALGGRGVVNDDERERVVVVVIVRSTILGLGGWLPLGVVHGELWGVVVASRGVPGLVAHRGEGSGSDQRRGSATGATCKAHPIAWSLVGRAASR